ncbi:hypothetical protein [Photobacterium phosphoreum]|jgi:hypothetical protein|uniref:hypothetical protein n=1 Tax=Photobacterium phosphoreum TaxID=659 RepID=UPI001E59B86B|nr:hypothetical protein [Photobacterium phosphoreum]MCD9469328.1 hypothetical protein [Photobacterium phosphoreum]
MNLDIAKSRIELLEHFDYSLRLFENNYDELLSVIDFMCDERVGLELFAVVNRWKLNEVLTHLGFKLHNYVCAAKSLVDHSRVLYRRVYRENAPIFDDYEAEVKTRFEENSLSKFIEFLRTYCQHEKLPSIGSSMSFDSRSDDGFIFTVTIDSGELLKSTSLKSLPKKFIKDQGEKIDLKDIVQNYHLQVIGFYQWVQDRQQEIHGEDIFLVNNHFKEERIKAINKFICSYSRYESVGTVKEQLYTVLATSTYKDLEQYKDDEVKWVEGAIAIIESDVVLPNDIKISLRSKATAFD